MEDGEPKWKRNKKSKDLGCLWKKKKQTFAYQHTTTSSANVDMLDAVMLETIFLQTHPVFTETKSRILIQTEIWN